jgi:hypothetical protein
MTSLDADENLQIPRLAKAVPLLFSSLLSNASMRHASHDIYPNSSKSNH